MSSLVIIRQGRKAQFTDEQKRDIAKTLGIGFIKLEYTDAEYIRSAYSTMGFQAVTISVVQRGQKTVRIPNWSTDEEGRPCPKGELVFKPDELNRGIAYLPDSPMNRRKLASAMSGNNALWRISDDTIRAEVEEMARMWEKQPEIIRALEHIEHLKVQERVAEEERKRNGEFGTSPIDSELQVWQLKIAELEKEQKLKEMKEKYEKLIRSQGRSVETDESNGSEPGTPSPSKKHGDSGATKADKAMAEIKSRIREEVYAEMSDVIERLKAEKPQGWAFTAEYRSKIKPVIDQRIAQELGNADNARTDNDD